MRNASHLIFGQDLAGQDISYLVILRDYDKYYDRNIQVKSLQILPACVKSLQILPACVKSLQIMTLSHYRLWQLASQRLSLKSHTTRQFRYHQMMSHQFGQ